MHHRDCQGHAVLDGKSISYRFGTLEVFQLRTCCGNKIDSLCEIFIGRGKLEFLQQRPILYRLGEYFFAYRELGKTKAFQ